MFCFYFIAPLRETKGGKQKYPTRNICSFVFLISIQFHQQIIYNVDETLNYIYRIIFAFAHIYFLILFKIVIATRLSRFSTPHRQTSSIRRFFFLLLFLNGGCIIFVHKWFETTKNNIKKQYHSHHFILIDFCYFFL